MNIAFLKQRVAELTSVSDQLAGRHNQIVGQLNEAKYLLEQFEKAEAEKSAERYVNYGVTDGAATLDGLCPEVEAALNKVGEV